MAHIVMVFDSKHGELLWHHGAESLLGFQDSVKAAYNLCIQVLEKPPETVLLESASQKYKASVKPLAKLNCNVALVQPVSIPDTTHAFQANECQQILLHFCHYAQFKSPKLAQYFSALLSEPEPTTMSCKLFDYAAELMHNLFQNVNKVNNLIALTSPQLMYSCYSLYIDGNLVSGQPDPVIRRVLSAYNLHHTTHQTTEHLYGTDDQSFVRKSCDIEAMIKPKKEDALYNLVKSVRATQRVGINLPPVPDLVCSAVGREGICIGVLMVNESQQPVSELVLDVYWLQRIQNCIDILVEQQLHAKIRDRLYSNVDAAFERQIDEFGYRHLSERLERRLFRLQAGPVETDPVQRIQNDFEATKIARDKGSFLPKQTKIREYQNPQFTTKLPAKLFLQNGSLCVSSLVSQDITSQFDKLRRNVLNDNSDPISAYLESVMPSGKELQVRVWGQGIKIDQVWVACHTEEGSDSDETTTFVAYESEGPLSVLGLK